MVDERGVPADAARPPGAPARPSSGPSGLVLCGGASRRFGSDKALAEVDGATLLDRTLLVLEQRCDRVFVACGTEPRYADRIAARAGRTAVVDRAAGIGPLAGLEAGLIAASELGAAASPWVLVAACDLPNLDTAVLDALLARAAEALAHVCVFADEGGDHPLLGCYHVEVLPAVRAAIDRGERRLISFWGDALPPSRALPGPNTVRVARLAAAEFDERRGSHAVNDPALNTNSRAELETWAHQRRANRDGATR